MITYTPGPWRTEKRNGMSAAEYVVADGGNSCGSVVVAVVPRAADRSLVESAPELLEALRDALRWIESLPDADLRLGTIMPEKIRAVLAKAEG
jgi:hypothetical protein